MVAADRRDAGGVLVLTLIVTVATLGFGLAMAVLARASSTGSGLHRDGIEAYYAADGGLEAIIDELSQLTDWSPVLAGGSSSRWGPTSTVVTTALVGSVDLAAMTTELQAETDAGAAWGANNPIWRLFAAGPISALWPDSGPAAAVFLVGWVSDDVGESDGVPAADSNRTIKIRVEARGRRGSRRIVEAVVAGTSTAGVVRQLSWREVR